MMLPQWDKMSTEGMFRYDVTECSTKVTSQSHSTINPALHHCPKDY